GRPRIEIEQLAGAGQAGAPGGRGDAGNIAGQLAGPPGEIVIGSKSANRWWRSTAVLGLNDHGIHAEPSTAGIPAEGDCAGRKVASKQPQSGVRRYQVL